MAIFLFDCLPKNLEVQDIFNLFYLQNLQLSPGESYSSSIWNKLNDIYSLCPGAILTLKKMKADGGHDSVENLVLAAYLFNRAHCVTWKAV